MKKEIYKNIFNWKFLFGIIISIVFSFFSFKNFQINTLFSLLNNINYSIIALAIFLLIFSVYLRAIRWKLLFNSSNIKTRSLFDAELIGYFGNNIFPLRFGEFLRCIIVSENYKISKTYIFGTVILERLLDMLGVIFVSIFLLILNYSILIDFILEFNLLYVFILIPFILFFSNKLYFFKNFFKNKFMKNIIDGISGINKENILFIILYTLLIWSIYIIEVYLIQSSIQLNLNFSECIFLLIISTFALSIPSSPANIGTFEFSIIFGMSTLGLYIDNQDLVISFSVLLHALTFIPYTILGGMLFIQNNYLINSNR